MRLNTASTNRRDQPLTAEGAPAKRISASQQLERIVMSSMLWEDGFYLDGVSIADAISKAANDLPAETLADVAVRAREDMKLRHVPLLLLAEMARKGGKITGDTVARVVSRPDETAELLAIYWRNGRVPVSKQLRRGLAEAFGKFDEYQLAKYDRPGTVKLRDVFRIVHPKPADAERSALYGRLVSGQLRTPDTWEVALSGGADKRDTFTRLLSENKLGYLALLRNLRNMTDAGVDRDLIRDAILARRGADRVLPFRYVAAARACPSVEPWLDEALCEAVLSAAPLPGKTIVLVDVSGSMNAHLSRKSDMRRMDAAATLASVIPSGDMRVFSFSDKVVEVPARRGMSGVDAIIRSQRHNGTDLRAAVQQANGTSHDRLIVITDEQSRTPVPDPVAKRAYMINVASEKNGVGYGKWTHIDGFSENVLRFIAANEQEKA